jgi:hypothetical protein
MPVQSARMKTNAFLRTLDTLLITSLVSLIMHATSPGTVEVPLAPAPSHDAWEGDTALVADDVSEAFRSIL